MANKLSLKKKVLTTKPAFSLIELLVSIGIIAMISGLFLASYRTGNKQAELTRSVSDLSSSYRKALNQTLGLSEFAGVVPQGGWGVHIDLNTDSTKYYVFADRNNNGQFDDGEADQESGGGIMNTPRNISIDSIVINDTTNVNYLDVIYIPPYPTIILYSPNIIELMTEAKITMLNSETGNTRAVEINFLGLIDMLN
jgi:prepilin-type N-terminal cleavage/methylation domain-containing protein